MNEVSSCPSGRIPPLAQWAPSNQSEMFWNSDGGTIKHGAVIYISWRTDVEGVLTWTANFLGTLDLDIEYS